MAFILQAVKKRRSYDGYSGDKIRVNFTKGTADKTVKTVVYFGKDVLKKLGFGIGDRIELYIDDHEPTMWWFNKGPQGLKLSNINNSNNVMAIQKMLPKDLSLDFEANIGYITWEIWEGGILAYLPKCPVEARQFLKSML